MSRSRSISSCAVGVLLATLMGMTSLAHAQTVFHVSAVAPFGGNGSASQPFVSIQDALNVAVTGDTVLVRPGIYVENILFNGFDVVVRSTAGAGATTIDGNAGFMCVRFVTGETNATVLRGFTLTNGASIDGAGILCVGSSPRIEDCIITANVAQNYGGGIHVFNGAPIIERCTIGGNSSGIGGGGITVASGSNVVIRHSTIYQNSAPTGGGCFGDNSTIVIEDSTIEANATTGGGDGGGLSLSYMTTTIRRSTIRDNSAEFGGGVWTYGGTALIDRTRILANSCMASGAGVAVYFTIADVRSTLIANNAASILGGGVYGSSSTITIAHATLRGNSAASGGGILLGFPPNANIVNSVLWGNSPDEIGTSFGGAVVSVTYSDVQGGMAGVGNINVDPQHVDPLQNDFNLSAASPCRNTGSNLAASNIIADLDGRPRMIGGTVDMGAAEYSARLAGSGEDLLLLTKVDGHDESVAIHATPGGSTLAIEMSTPLGGFLGVPPILLGEFFAVGAPPVGPGGFPELHVSLGGAQILYDATANGIFGVPALSPTPFVLTSSIYPGLAGFGGRLQFLAITPFASNGYFATSDAHDLIFN
jgi:hypothetical protein